MSQRHLQLQGCVNLRDMGGYTTRDGRHVRWSTLYRSDSLHRTTADSCARMVDELGVRMFLDLRSEGERHDLGEAPLPPTVRVDYLPVVRDLFSPLPGELEPPQRFTDMASTYLRFFAVGGADLARALKILAEPQALPAMFACFSGKDRTGVMAAFLLAILGVPDEEIVADYALTERCIDDIRGRLRAQYPNLDEDWIRFPGQIMDVAAIELGEAVAGLRADEGSVEAYAIRHGASITTIERVRDLLLE